MQRNLGPFHLIFSIFLLLVFAIAGFWIALMPQRMAQQLGTSIEAALPLGFAHAGPTSIGWNNGLEARIADVRLTNVGLPETFTLAAKSIRLPASFSLAEGLPVGQSLVLEEPVITAEIGAGFADAIGVAKKQDLSSEQRAGQRLRLRLVSGTFRLRDRASDMTIQLLDVNGNLHVSDQGAVLLHVTGLLNGEHTTVRLEADDANRLLTEGSPSDLLISSDKGELRFSGRTGWGKGLAMDGRMFLASRNSNDLLAWLGLPAVLAPATRIEAESAVSVAASRLEMFDLTLRLGATTTTGRFLMQSRKEHLAFEGKISGKHIDLSAIWPGLGLARGWSDRPFHWLPWRSLVGRLQMDAESLKLGAVQLQQSQLTAALEDNSATFNLIASGGDVAAQLSFSNESRTRMQASITLGSANGGEIAQTLFGGKWLSGRLGGTTDVSATGHSAAALISTLTGSFDIKLEDGRISGYSIRDQLAVPGRGWQATAGHDTQDVRASMRGNISEGVATVASGSLQAAGLKLALSGEVDILRRDLAIDVTPQAIQGLPALIGIVGPWNDPHFGTESARAAWSQAAPNASSN